MKINFSQCKAYDIGGNEIKEIEMHKTLANALYSKTTIVDIAELAMKINKGGEVEIDEKHLPEIKRIINDNQGHVLFAFVKKALLDFIDKHTKKDESKK